MKRIILNRIDGGTITSSGTLFGTVVGSTIVLFLSKRPIYSFLQPIPGLNDTKAAFLLGALGLAYCYVASAPMLTIHALRGEFSLRLKPKTWRQIAIIFSTLGLVVGGGFYLSFLHYGSQSAIDIKSLATLSLIVAAQGTSIILGVKRNFIKTSHFYSNLSRARAEEGNVPNYVESYRHLREHGNAYSIIVFEIILAFVLASVSSTWEIALAILLWVFPAGCCWFIATALEGALADISRRHISILFEKPPG